MNIVSQFLSFNKLMGSTLVKIFYYLGLIGIVLGCVGWLLAGLTTMFNVHFMTGLGMIIGAPIFGVLAVCGLRLACELYAAVFRIADDLTAMRGAGGMIPPKA
jgi:hypothetical protein